MPSTWLWPPAKACRSITWDREQRERGGAWVDAQEPATQPEQPQERTTSDPALYDVLAEMIERRLRERHPHRTWRVLRAEECRQTAVRSGVPVDFSGITVEGNLEGAPIRQQVGILNVDLDRVDEAYIDRIARIIEDQFPGLSS